MIPAACLLSSLLLVTPASAATARDVVETFLARLANVSVTDMVVTETFTLYHPDGRDVQATGQRRLFVKIPGRQRIEETIEGRRQVQLVVDGHAWVRRADGAVYEAPPGEAARGRADLLTPFRHNAAELLAVWRSLGIRDDVVHEERVGDRTVTVIGARAGDRTSPAVWLDPERGVVRFIARETLPRRTGLVDLTLSDHRPVLGDFYYPFRQEVFLDGKLLTRIVVQAVEVNTRLADDLFDPAALRRGR